MPSRVANNRRGASTVDRRALDCCCVRPVKRRSQRSPIPQQVGTGCEKRGRETEKTNASRCYSHPGMYVLPMLSPGGRQTPWMRRGAVGCLSGVRGGTNTGNTTTPSSHSGKHQNHRSGKDAVPRLIAESAHRTKPCYFLVRQEQSDRKLTRPHACTLWSLFSALLGLLASE